MFNWNGSYIMFLAVYAVIKDSLIFWKPKEKKQVTFPVKLIIILLSILVFMVIFIAITPLVLFRMCLGIYLKVKHGKLYGGFLTGQDSLFEVNTDKIVFNVVLILSTQNESTILYEKFKKAARSIHNASYKFACNIQRLYGYSYYLKEQIKFDTDDVIINIKINNEECLSKDMLFDFLEKNCNTIKTNQMWQMIFVSQRIKWNKNINDDMKQYAVIITFRHSLGDGPTVAGILRKYVLSENSMSKKNILNSESSKTILNLDNVFVYRNPLTTKLDQTLLKIENNLNWHILTYTEPTIKYVPLIREIKKELNVGFSQVLGAAICAGISDYIIKRKVKMDNFTLAIIIRVVDKELKEIINGTYNFEKLINNSAVITVNIPVQQQSMKNNILYLHRCGENMKTAIDFFLAYGVIDNIVTYLPVPIVKLFEQTYMEGMTVGFTNMIGFPKGTCCDAEVSDMFSFTPQFMKTGFTFNVLSYGDKLQMSISSRRGFVYSRNDIQDIIASILNKLDQAQREIVSCGHVYS